MDLFVFLAEDLTKLAFVLETKEGLSCQVPVVWFFFKVLNVRGGGWDFEKLQVPGGNTFWCL